MVLYFKNPSFNVGENITCRRGVKWDTVEKKNVSIVDTDKQESVLYVVNIETKVMCFNDLQDADVAAEHDPICRTVDGLYGVMKSLYGDFDKREMITLCKFNIN